MPSYRTHVSVNLLLALPVALAAMRCTLLSTPYDMALFAGSFIYGTLFLHPDLDLARNIRLFSFKGLLTLPFRPYSYLFRHRGISHMPLIGTLTRIGWLTLLFWIFFHKAFAWDNPLLWFAAGGLAVADLAHIVLDHLA